MASRLCLLPLRRMALPGLRSPAMGSARRQLQLHRPSASRAFSARTAFLAKKYSEDHEWVELDSDGTTGVVGISKYAAGSLGEVVFVEVPELHLEINQGDVFGSVESTKAASDIMAPMAGEVLEVNEQLQDNPKLINDSPEGEGWICKMKVKDLKELDNLMDSDAYNKFTKELSED